MNLGLYEAALWHLGPQPNTSIGTQLCLWVYREVNNESPSARHQSPQKCDDVVADSQGTDEELSAEEVSVIAMLLIFHPLGRFFKEPDVDDLESKAAILFSLYERYSGEKCKLPEKTNCPLRDGWLNLLWFIHANKGVRIFPYAFSASLG